MAASDARSHGWASWFVAPMTLLLPLGALLWQLSLVWPVAEAAPLPVFPSAEEFESVPTEPPPELAMVVVASPEAIPEMVPAPPEPPAAVVLELADPTAPVRQAWTRESTFNFVAVGIDRRDEYEIPRTDTIIIGNVDLPNRRLSLVSVPRDLLVEIPGFGFDRINAAYAYGQQFTEPDGGIGLLRRTVEWNFAIPIHHFGMVDFQCFRTTVDAIGGVTVDVPRTIVDPRYPTDDFGYKLVRFDAGPQLMDGQRALEYARTRHPDNDFGRIRRQQQVVAALRQQVLQLRALPAVPAILSGCRNMSSDLGLMDYLALAGTLRQFGDGDIAMRTIDERMATETVTLSGAEVLMPSWEPIRALVRDTFRSTSAAATNSMATR